MRKFAYIVACAALCLCFVVACAEEVRGSATYESNIDTCWENTNADEPTSCDESTPWHCVAASDRTTVYCYNTQILCIADSPCS